MERSVQLETNKVKKQRRQAHYNQLNRAKLEVIEKGLSIPEAGRRFNVPRTTLRDWVKRSRNQGDGDVENISYSFTTFTREQEEAILEHCRKMSSIGYPYAPWQVIDLAQNMARQILDFSLPNTKLPTESWFKNFKRRHPDYKTSKPKKRELSKKTVSKETIITYFKELEQTMDEIGVEARPKQIWNLDETGVVLDHSPPKVLHKATDKCEMVSCGKSPTTTLIAAVSAYGESLPPYIVHKEKATREMKEGVLEGTVFKESQSGWSNSEIFREYMTEHFCKHVTARPILLLFDGHSSHYTSHVIAEAKERGIHLYALPPHTSHFLQPLDKSVFGPFKKRLYNMIHSWLHDHPGQLVTKNLLPRMLCNSLIDSMTVSNIQAGFRSTGIFPFNQNAIPLVREEKQVERKNREPNNSTNTMIQLMDGITQHYVGKIKSVKKKRKTFIPPQGGCITNGDFLEKKIEQETTNFAKKGKPYVPPFTRNFLQIDSEETDSAEEDMEVTASSPFFRDASAPKKKCSYRSRK